ncbi:MAG: PAS domain S-box protein [Desulforhabdus sp.]|jgi:PAS domain S-box-containing protein|nr:PAS domain S-box protein [Desulforhabdus sp.]
MLNSPLKILLITASEVSCRAVLESLARIATMNIRVDLLLEYDRAPDEILAGSHDLYLLDCDLEKRSALDLLKQMKAKELKKPLILLTEQALDARSEAGAWPVGVWDCLVKSKISTPLLERSILCSVLLKDTRTDPMGIEEPCHTPAENQRDAYYRLNYNTMRYDYFSPAIKKLTGYNGEELERFGFSRLIDRIDLPDKTNASKEVVVRNRRKEHEFRADYLIMKKNGETVWLRDQAFPWYDESGKPVGFVGILSDVTELKRAEESLRESEKHLRFLFSRFLEIQEEERGRLARELHDIFGQTLVAIKFGIEAAIGAAKISNSEATVDSLKPLVSMAQEAIEDMKKMYISLRPTILDDFGVIAAIEWLCSEFEKVHPSICVEEKITLAEEDVPEHLKIVIYRIVQGAIENTARHSNASELRVSLGTSRRSIKVSVKDNGHGFDPKKTLSPYNHDTGLGLASMRERAILSGGSFDVKSGVRSGTTVKAEWPRT